MFNFFSRLLVKPHNLFNETLGYGVTRNIPTKRLEVNYRTLDSLRVRVKLPENPYDLYVYLYLNWETSRSNGERRRSLPRMESYESLQ